MVLTAAEKCRSWRERHPDRYKEYKQLQLNHRRNGYVRVGGKFIGVPNKRPRPDGICELCGGGYHDILHYHHWDDNNPQFGVWLCFKHHHFAEAVDGGLYNKYIQVKADAVVESIVG